MVASRSFETSAFSRAMSASSDNRWAAARMFSCMTVCSTLPCTPFSRPLASPRRHARAAFLLPDLPGRGNAQRAFLVRDGAIVTAICDLRPRGHGESRAFLFFAVTNVAGLHCHDPSDRSVASSWIAAAVHWPPVGTWGLTDTNVRTIFGAHDRHRRPKGRADPPDDRRACGP